MLTVEALDQRREEIEAAPELTALLRRLEQRAGPLLDRMPVVPADKALLTADGGVCPDEGTRLEFDPWNATQHRCPQCGKWVTGDRHDRAWAHYQHLWLAERMAHLAIVGVMAGRPEAVRRSEQLLQAYRGYSSYPNRDNVLGPSHLFFSTYLESIWIANYLAAAILLREADELSGETAAIVSSVADEAATLIGEFDEGLSNRQTWHNAALASIAVWFEDEELATRVIEGPTGVIAHLLHGFGSDGMWYEGDNYHLFALRGQLLAMGWAGQAGVDLMADPRLARRLTDALRAPALTALPDFTFPARKDSRFGVSLAQPMYLELWEIGLARLGNSPEVRQLWGWLQDLYQSSAPVAQTFDSYLHEAGESPPQRPRTRADLSWWALLEMAPSFPSDTATWSPGSAFIEGQGLAVFRAGDRYAALECGPSGGGHGHPDRLNLILHAEGEYWLPDYGTGSYVNRDLFWYRSTLAHNAPRLDARSQPWDDAACENFDLAGDWGWARGRFRELTRTLLVGPRYLLDQVELASGQDHVLELPLHLAGRVEAAPKGEWVPAGLEDEFVTQAERFVPDTAEPLVLRSTGRGGVTLNVHLSFEGELLRAQAPGAPGSIGLTTFYLLRARGSNSRITMLLEPGDSTVRAIQVAGSSVEVITERGTERHISTLEGWEIWAGGRVLKLAGPRKPPPRFEPLVRTDRPLVAHGVALYCDEPPSLDGTLDGFHTSEPLELDHEDQYRRSEEPYAGSDEFSARAYVNWSPGELYLAVEVVKPQVFAWDPESPPRRLDNEPDQIHADGIQVYFKLPGEDMVHGLLVVPAFPGGRLVTRPVGMKESQAAVRGSWQRSESGYTLAIAITTAGLRELRAGDEIDFDLLVNQMLPDRERRAGQLVWTGGGGWVWLRGDRQDPSRFGKLRLE